ncbi:MAG: MBOAT family protein, partial [Rhodocyclaceae bacterium]|nr:MBOAT family protein [Rhodocyclaceae bacterium]
YKYADFFIGSVNALTGSQIALLQLVLPLGISFFTFTQIAFLVDSYRGKAREYRFVYYVLFVTYFPHLIAGPVLHHKEMMPQFDLDRNYRLRAQNFQIGMSIFWLGMAKKVLLADNLAGYANGLFGATDPPTLFIAWGGVLAYALQLYFDFSGYSDMAIGLSRMLGVRLPLNFNSPYKARNIIDFWRRWHMTLSRFLRDYLYFSLGGNRNGKLRRHVNLLLTMLLGGLWHGAGWNFVIWGGLHGLYLGINHAWLEFKARMGLGGYGKPGAVLAVTITFISVCYAWVFFRAPDLPRALQIVAGMSGANGIALPDALFAGHAGLREALAGLGIQFFLGGTSRFLETWGYVIVIAPIAFFMPNTQEIMRRYAPALDVADAPLAPSVVNLRWRPRARWAAGIACLAALCVMSLARPSEFLYFQF